MKSSVFYISLSLLIIMVVHAHTTEARYKAELCKYFVARAASQSLAAYNDESKRELPWNDVSESIARRWESVMVNRSTTSARGDALAGQLSVYKLPRKFLKHDVYEVWRLGFDRGVFRIGLDDQFNFVKLWGFNDPVTRVGEYGIFMDTINFPHFESGDLPLKNKLKFDQFIGYWIHLTQYSGSSKQFKIVSNDFEVSLLDNVTGTCQTAEFHWVYPDSGENDKVVYKEWSYRIPSFGFTQLELLSIRESEDLSVFSGSL